VTHQAREIDDERAVIRSETAIDGRWIRIRRPVITVGGELSLDMLDLKFNPLSAFYEAPLQLKANGGVLVVDDFGRQRVPARDLLNRWIVPLEARVDYLSLHTGRKFQVPFDVLIVFATNLEPRSLADEAFLRRIPYKIFAKNPTVDQFSRIFEMNCRRHGIPFDPALVEYLQERYYRQRNLPMRACHPRDLIDQAVSLCRYHQRAPELTPALIDAVCQSYFLDDSQPGAPGAA
jgi:SpoVK/Ycf46/Vps4 family AAA+-type ATPase